MMDFIQKNLLLIGVALISGAMLLWPLLRRASGGPWVSSLEATQLINQEDALVVDVRDAVDYARGHLLGARHLAPDQIERRIAEVAKNKNKPLIVYCDGGNGSGRALDSLKKLGYARVYNLSGGYSAWRQAGLPTEKQHG